MFIVSARAEHVVVSPSEADRELSPNILRKKCREAMLRRGVLGGCEIPHGRSIDKASQKLVWHFHVHALVLIRGGLMFVGIVVGTLRRIVRFVMGLRGDRCGSMRRTGIS